MTTILFHFYFLVERGLGRAVRFSIWAVHVFAALSLRRIWPSYGPFYLVVFQGNCLWGCMIIIKHDYLKQKLLLQPFFRGCQLKITYKYTFSPNVLTRVYT